MRAVATLLHHRSHGYPGARCVGLLQPGPTPKWCSPAAASRPPGIGTVSNAFVSALRSKVNKNVRVYAVKYPADNQIVWAPTDMSAHIQSITNSCPNTRLVPGGYSLGAAVTGVVLAVPTPRCGSFTIPCLQQW